MSGGHRSNVATKIHRLGRREPGKPKQPGNTDYPTEQTVSHLCAIARAIVSRRIRAPPILFIRKNSLQTSKSNKMTFKIPNLTLLVPPALAAWASLAQLVEHSICNRTVVGSSPTTGSIYFQSSSFTTTLGQAWPRRCQPNPHVDRCCLACRARSFVLE